LLSPTAGTLGRAFPGKGRLGWGGDKKGGIGVGVGDLGDVVPSVEPVRSHAGVNVAGPPTCESNAGGRRKKVEEFGDIRGWDRRVEVEDVRHFNVILLLNSITEMRGGVMGEGLQACPADFRVVFLFRLGPSVKTGREG
jgi:hypothetical protein